MTKNELRKHLQADGFKPFDIVTSGGSRYTVEHPDFAIITGDGSIYIFKPSQGEPDNTEFVGIASLLHIASIERPQQNTTDSAA
ncbi:MAG: hypothetical protein AAGI68_13195 [Planctomycetota bacterium]